jgi:hypothetical protein
MNSNNNVYRKKNNRQNNRQKGRSNPNKTPQAPMARPTKVTAMKKSGDLHNKIFNKNQVITAGSWDLFSLSSIAKGTGEDERIGSKICTREMR